MTGAAITDDDVDEIEGILNRGSTESLGFNFDRRPSRNQPNFTASLLANHQGSSRPGTATAGIGGGKNDQAIPPIMEEKSGPVGRILTSANASAVTSSNPILAEVPRMPPSARRSSLIWKELATPKGIAGIVANGGDSNSSAQQVVPVSQTAVTSAIGARRMSLTAKLAGSAAVMQDAILSGTSQAAVPEEENPFETPADPQQQQAQAIAAATSAAVSSQMDSLREAVRGLERFMKMEAKASRERMRRLEEFVEGEVRREVEQTKTVSEEVRKLSVDVTRIMRAVDGPPTREVAEYGSTTKTAGKRAASARVHPSE
ncbi:hypothetical protein HK101_004721 [Irineochytrium annulatum]|nr:hypothetical protein HK101_004721 [Irineochytrium annulatum]